MLTPGARRPPLSILGPFPPLHKTRVPALGSFPESQFSSVLRGWQGVLARQAGSRRWVFSLELADPPARALGTSPASLCSLRGHSVGPGSLVPVSHFGRRSWAIAGRYSAGKHAPVPCGWGRARENTDSFPGLGNSAPCLSLAQRTVMGERGACLNEPVFRGLRLTFFHVAAVTGWSRGSGKFMTPTRVQHWAGCRGGHAL